MQRTKAEVADTTDLPPAPGSPQRFFVADGPVLTFEFGAVTHPGKVRGENEDRYAIMKRTRASEIVASNVDFADSPRQRDDAYLLVVADGMGGEAFGDFASELAIKTAWEWAGRAASWVMKLRDIDAQQVQERVDAFARMIQMEMASQEAADPRLAGMGTTWTSAYLMNRDAIVAHVGDSRAYVFRKSNLVAITRDHTLAQDLVASGANPEAVRRFRSVLTRAFRGEESDGHPDVAHVQLEVGDLLLLCSDGLTDVVGPGEIAQTLAALHRPQAACDALLDKALAAGGPDNVTILAAKVASAS